MKVRLIKPGMSPANDKDDQPPVEAQITDTIQSWVSDFHSMKAKRTRLDFEQVNNPPKT